MKEEVLNIVYTYYNNQHALEKQLENWQAYPKDIADRIRLILVDDHSQVPVKGDFNLPLDITLLRIDKDIPWNQPGARNLGFKFVTTDWAFVSDIDHLLTAEACRLLIDKGKDPLRVYYFDRQILIDDVVKPFRPHPNSYLISRGTFWKVGGYHEDFCGNYGSDDSFFNYLLERQFTIERLQEVQLTTFPSHDNNTHLDRDKKKNTKLLKRKIREYNKGRYDNNSLLRFPWHIVSLY